jgi:hypothetical protein
MTIGSILLAIALFIVLLLYLSRPFLTPSPAVEPLKLRQKLLAQKENLLNQIRALDFDHNTGKIPDDIYQTERSHLIHEAAHVLQQLDSQAADPTNIEVAIETAVASLRQISSNGQSALCPQCGRPTDPHDKFCAGCGHQLVEVIG